MELKDELKCAESVLEFLLESYPKEKIYRLKKGITSVYNDLTTTQEIMENILNENNVDMLSLTQHLNYKYNIYDGLLWSYSVKEFFYTTKAINFYRKVIRELKIDLICRR